MKIRTCLLLSLLLAVVVAEPADGCWCVRKTLYTAEEFRAAVSEELQVSAVAFSGEVIEKTPTSITLKVATVWKGVIPPSVRLSMQYLSREGPKSEVMLVLCEYNHFEVGKSFLVYADSFEGQLQVSECSRTQPLGDAANDISMLNELTTPHSPQQAPKNSVPGLVPTATTSNKLRGRTGSQQAYSTPPPN